LRMARNHLGYGVGLGAFEVAYPRFQSFASDSAIDYAHNDYAQLFAECGFLGWILVPVSIGMFLVLSFRHLRRRLRDTGGWLQLGAAVGVCGVLVHSFSDFNLHIPANAAWFSAAVALAVLDPSTTFAGSR
jgi:O-antigen ligase